MADNFGNGQMQPSDGASEFNAAEFHIQRALARVRTMVLVKVIAVTNAGELAPVGFVDVQPLVNMLDGAGTATPHGTIFNMPYTRIQGGANAVILDPEVDDIGWAAIADRDISSVKTAKKPSNPGSFRRHDLADGVYIGGILNGQATQYVRFASTGIELVSPTKVRIQAPTVEIAASTALNVISPTSTFTGNLTVTGAIQAASAAISGAFTAVSLALTGTFSALSAAISGALTANSVQATTTVKSLAGAHDLTSHVHVYIPPSVSPGAPTNTSASVG